MSLQIIISGVGRSGTTALYRLLQQLMRRNDLSPRCIYEPYLWRPEVFEHLAVDDEAFTRAFRSTSALSIEGMYAHARTPLFARASPPEHAMFIDRLFVARQPALVKVIRGCGRLETFLSAVPNLKIIHIVRNPLDVVNSALGLFSFFGDEYHPSDKPRFVRELRERFGVNVLPETVRLEVQWSALWWRYMNEAALDTATRFQARVLAVSHEALRSEPAATVREIAGFCELDAQRLDMELVGEPLGSTGAEAKLDAEMLADLRPLDRSYWSGMLPRLDRGVEFDRDAVQRAVASKYASPPVRSAPLDWLPSDFAAPALRRELGRAVHQLERLRADGGAHLRDRLSRLGRTKEARWRRKLRKLPRKFGSRFSTLFARGSFRAQPGPKPRSRRIALSDRRPPIACIITSYNNGSALKNAILSVCTQTLPVAEVVVSDDASTDGSRELIQHLAGEFPNIKPVLREQNLGPGLNRHLAMLASTAPFITQLDGDDAIHPKKMEQEAEALNGGIDAIALSDWLTVDSDGRTRHFSVREFARLATRADRLKAMLSRSIPLPHSMLYSRDLYFSSGGYETSAMMYEDLGLKLRLAREADAWCYSEGCGLYYNKHVWGLSAAPRPIHAFWLLYCLAQNFDWLKQHLSVDDLRQVVAHWFGEFVQDQDLVEKVSKALEPGDDHALEALERGLFQLARARQSRITLPEAAEILERFACSLFSSSAVTPIERPDRATRRMLSAAK